MSDRSQHTSNATPWQSLDHLAGDLVDKGESINGTTAGSLVDSAVSRRGFMTIMGASMALTAAACRRPDQKLIASVESKQVPAPGLPVDYASVYSHRNVAYGALNILCGPSIEINGTEQAGVLVGTLKTLFSNEAERTVFSQAVCALTQ